MVDGNRIAESITIVFDGSIAVSVRQTQTADVLAGEPTRLLQVEVNRLLSPSALARTSKSVVVVDLVFGEHDVGFVS